MLQVTMQVLQISSYGQRLE